MGQDWLMGGVMPGMASCLLMDEADQWQGMMGAVLGMPFERRRAFSAGTKKHPFRVPLLLCNVCVLTALRSAACRAFTMPCGIWQPAGLAAGRRPGSLAASRRPGGPDDLSDYFL